MTLFFASLHYNDKLYDDRLVELKWMNLFIENTVCAVLPVIPMVFPAMWILINLWGIARLETHLAQPQTRTKLEQQKSFQEDLDTPTFECDTVELPFKQVFFNWISLWRGYSMLLGRSANVVQVLGSITALCCVDKKGILSWPNPTPEKVFFLHDSTDGPSPNESPNPFQTPRKQETKVVKEQNKSVSDTIESHSTQTPTRTIGTNVTVNVSKRNSNRIIETHKHPGTVAEVLDLTHDQYSPFRIDFDDHGWKTHIDSLKPLGKTFRK